MELSNSTVWTPEPEIEGPAPTRIQLPPKHSPFTNGMLKRHAPPVVTYRECLKNHAVALGGHAVDGCGEFMLSPASNPADPTSIRCAACDCHRSFHRRHHPPPPDGATISDVSHDGGVNNNTPLSSSGGQKRFRTKFTHSQMEKILELAERVGWRMQRKDEELLNIFL